MKKVIVITFFISLISLTCSQAATIPPPAPVTPTPASAPSTDRSNSLTPYIITFEASKDNIQAGTSITLSWEVTNATLVSIDQNIGTVPAKGSRKITPKATGTFILTATNNSGSTTTSVHVTVSGTIPESTPSSFNLPEVVVLTAEPSNIVSEQEVILAWDVRNAYDVIIEPGFRIIPVKGTATVMPVFTTTYKLTATNDQGKILAATTVTVSGVPPSEETPVIKFLKADRYVIKKGESAELRWKTTEASSVSIDKGVGTVSGEGTAKVSPASTTIYTMIATNPRGAQYQTIVVNVK